MAPGASNKVPIRLGAEGQDAANVPVPLEVDEEGGEDGGGGKKRSGIEAAPGLPSPKKERPSGTVTLDVERVRELLADQSRELLAAQQRQLATAVHEMEERVEARVGKVEQQMAEVHGRSEVLEGRIVELEAALKDLKGLVQTGAVQAVPKDDAERRKSTLVVGGWPRDSRRQDILKELEMAIRRLGLAGMVDQQAFCTGPRRSVALLPMPLRANETEQARRDRMYKFVTAFGENEVMSGASTRLWCNFSKSPEERAVASHAALVKRTVALFNETTAREQLDFEYKTGTAWGPAGMLCSVRLPVPPQHDHSGIDVDQDSPHKQWVDVGLIAKLVPPEVEQRATWRRMAERSSGDSLRIDGLQPLDVSEGLRPDGVDRQSRLSGGRDDASPGEPTSSMQGCTDFDKPRVRELRAGLQSGLQVKVFGWNVGGCDISNFKQGVRDATGCGLEATALVALQELPRAGEGWSSEKQGDLEIVSHRCKEAWRGTGIAFSSRCWCVLRRYAAERGTWFRLRHLESGSLLWVGTAHFTPGCTHAQYEQEVVGFFGKAPRNSDSVVCTFDANAPIRWGECEGGLLPVGKDGKANEVLGRVAEKGLVVMPPEPDQLRTPTSRPRQEGRRGSIIDYMCGSRVSRVSVRVHEDSCHVLGTDHELLEGIFRIAPGKPYKRYSTRPRVWVGGISEIHHVDQTVLTHYAEKYTVPARGYGYRDPPQFKQAIARARLSRTKASWVQVRSLRQKARKVWEADRLARASQGDWQAFRQCRVKTQTGWEHSFADAQDRDPHTVVHDHLEAVYEGRGVEPNKGVFPGETAAFTVEELDKALGQMQTSKSVGVDGTSTELLVGMSKVQGGKSHILEFMNRVLITHEIPADWNTPLMVLLPKVLTPKEAKQLRPISMGSAACKLFSRLLLNRTIPFIAPKTHSQCAGVGRQTADYLFSVWRVLELDREWRAGLCLLKLDVAQAFDTVDRERLLAKLRERMGDCAMLRCWRALLQDSHAILQTPWGVSMLSMQKGIKQGAVESPALFAMIAEVCLSEAAERYEWSKQAQVFPGMPHQDVLFMDDGLLWSRGVEGLQQRVRQLMVVLFEYGLKLNGGKCQLLCSPHWHGDKHVWIAGERVEAVEELEVMGLPMKVGMTTSGLVSPLLARARDKFWSLHHIFRARTQLKGRMKSLATAIGNSVLWCVAAFPPDRAAMGLMNTMQLQLVIWTMRLAKRSDEGWDAFRLRSFRSARAALHNCGQERWSTCWLRRWWRFSGHRSRSMLRDFPPLSAQLDAFRTLDWWEAQKRSTDGITHPHHYPRLMNMERAMHKASGGDWRVVAQDRKGWRGKENGTFLIAAVARLGPCYFARLLTEWLLFMVFLRMRSCQMQLAPLMSIALWVLVCFVWDGSGSPSADGPHAPFDDSADQEEARRTEDPRDVLNGTIREFGNGTNGVDEGPTSGEEVLNQGELQHSTELENDNDDTLAGLPGALQPEVGRWWFSAETRLRELQRAGCGNDRVIQQIRTLASHREIRSYMQYAEILLETLRSRVQGHPGAVDNVDDLAWSVDVEHSLWLSWTSMRLPPPGVVPEPVGIFNAVDGIRPGNATYTVLKRRRIGDLVAGPEPEGHEELTGGSCSSSSSVGSCVPPSNASDGAGSVQADHIDDEGNGEETGLFQLRAADIPTWESLVEQLGEWWDEGMQVGEAICMVRGISEGRRDDLYLRWLRGPLGSLGMDIVHSEHTSYEVGPPNFFRWAETIEGILWRCFCRDREQGTLQGDAEVDRNMVAEGGLARSAEMTEVIDVESVEVVKTWKVDVIVVVLVPAQRRKKPEEFKPKPTRPSRASGCGSSTDGPRGSGAGSSTDRPSERDGRPGSSTDFDMSMTFFPNGPRDTDEGVDIWRYILGICTTDLPRGLATVPNGGPFISDDRADYIAEVLRGYTVHQQLLMTISLVTAVRAIMHELGAVMHAASLVEVELDGSDRDEVAVEVRDDDDEGHTSLVQLEATKVYGLVQHLQRELEGPSPGLARLRAANLHERLRRIRRVPGQLDVDLIDQAEALCVAVEDTGRRHVPTGFLSEPSQVDEWASQWWNRLQPMICGPSGAVSLSSSLPASSLDRVNEDVDCAVINELIEDMKETARDAEGLDEMQARFEQEEAEYLKGVQQAVEHHMGEEETRKCRDWDDWALFDEMHSGARPRRKRSILAVSLGSVAGGPGPEKRWKIPVAVGQEVRIRVEEEDGSEAETEVAEPVGVVSPGLASTTNSLEDTVPLNFLEFQRVYQQWRQGQMTEEMIRGLYGAATVEMMQAQLVVAKMEDEELPGEGRKQADLAATLLDAVLNESQGAVVAEGVAEQVIPGSVFYGACDGHDAGPDSALLVLGGEADQGTRSEMRDDEAHGPAEEEG
ncbi:unnamed protein product [Symbiodinium sp. CCMP2592]|nr:unnamed protein product [Symbiodinium sp. CCMP2592]